MRQLFLLTALSSAALAQPLPGASLQAAVDAAVARGARGFALAPGATYAFGAASFVLRGAASFALDGAGATLVFAPGAGVLVRESRDSSVANLTVAYDPPCFTQGLIVASDAGARTVDVRLDDGYPAPNASAAATAYFRSAEVKLQFWNPATRLRVPGQSPACVVDIDSVPVSPGVWRVSNACSVPQGVPGMLATISPRIGATFDIPQFYRGGAWWVHASENILSEDITLTGSGNFAVLEWGGAGKHTYRRLTVARVGSNLLSSNTDGFHSFSVGAGPHIDSCHISLMGDDALNFHNRVAVVLAVVDGGASVQIVDLSDVPSPDLDAPPVSALADLVEGDALRFMTAAQRTPHGTGVVAGVSRVTDPAVIAAARALAVALPGVSVDPAAVVVWLVALAGGVGSSGISAGDIVQFDRRAVAGGLVENSVFTDAYDGVMRLQAANTTLRNNTWQRTAWKLQIVYDPSWKEGATDVANVLVEKNNFVDILYPPATTMAQITDIDSNVVNVTLVGNTVSASSGPAIAEGSTGAAGATADVVLDAGAGLTWRIVSVPGGAAAPQYALGQPMLRGEPLDNLVVDNGIAFWRRMSDALVVPVLGTSIVVDASGAAATLSGSAVLPSGGPGDNATDTAVSVRIALDGAYSAASISVSFSSEAGLAANSWQLCVKWAHDGSSADVWRAQGYPLAANASHVDGARLEYVGWPGFLLFRPNASVVAWFGVSSLEDFSNPNTWTGATSFTFSSDGGYLVAPQYWLGAAGLAPGQVCELTLRLLASSAGGGVGDTLAAVRELVPQLMRIDGYAVEPMPPIRSAADMLACFVNARRVTPMWRSTPNGSAYQLQDIASFIYLGTTPESAFFEYNLFLSSGDYVWRNRSFAQMAFWLQGQLLDTASRHYGAVNTVYELPAGPYDSTDRGNNVGFKLDLNGHMSRYALLLVEAVRAHEPDVDVSAWLTAATLSAQWIWRMGAAQAGGASGAPAGSAGFPQMIASRDDAPTPSVVSGRLLNALPVFARVIGDTAAYNFSALFAAARAWHVDNIERTLFYTAQHPDLPWDDQEQDSVWEVAEMWLDVSDDSASSPAQKAEALSRAVGNVMLAFLMLCPKQLTWVTHPTQMAADEQQMYSQ
jgi:hypothetical protein